MFYELTFLICSTLSVISTGILFFLFCLHKKSRTLGFKMVFPIIFFDFVYSICYFCPIAYYFFSTDPQLSDSLCKLQAFLKLYSKNGTLFSALSVSYILHSIFIKNKQINKKNPIAHLNWFMFILPLFIAVIPYFSDSFGFTQPLSEVLCFLIVKYPSDGSTDIVGILLKVFCYIIPIFLTTLLEIYFIVRIYYDYRKKGYDRYTTDIKNILYYPVFFLLTWIWITIERFYELVNHGKTIEVLNSFALQVCVLNGFFNSIIYGYLTLKPFSKCKKSKLNTQENNIKTVDFQKIYIDEEDDNVSYKNLLQ